MRAVAMRGGVKRGRARLLSDAGIRGGDAVEVFFGQAANCECKFFRAAGIFFDEVARHGVTVASGIGPAG